MKKSFIVIGIGRFGLSVAKSLSNANADVMAIDTNEVAASQAAKFMEKVAICDATKIEALRELSVSSVDHAIVAIGNNLTATILTTVNLKELGVKKITVRLDTDEYENLLMRLGATEVVIPEEASALSLSYAILSDTILDYYHVEGEYAIVQVKVGEKFQSKTLIELNFRNEFDISVVGIIRNEKFILPKGQDFIQSNDIILVIGTNKKVSNFDEYIHKNQ